MNVRLIIPDLKDEAYFRNSYIEDKLKAIANIAGGYTSYRGHGGWIDSKGLLVEEPITIVDCSLEDCQRNWSRPIAPLFRQLARTIARELSQECVFLSIDGKAEFIRP